MVPRCLSACALKLLAHSARDVDEVLNASVSTRPEQDFQQCPPRPHKYVERRFGTMVITQGGHTSSAPSSCTLVIVL